MLRRLLILLVLVMLPVIVLAQEDLGQTGTIVRASGDEVTLGFPDSWLSSEDGGTLVVWSDSQALDNFVNGNTMSGRQTVVVILAISHDDLGAGDDLEDALNTQLDIEEGQTDFKFGRAREYTDVIFPAFAARSLEDNYNALALMIDLGGDPGEWLYWVFVTAPGSLTDFEPTAAAMVNSLQGDFGPEPEPLDLTESFFDRDAPMTFDYPEDWVTTMLSDGTVYLANNFDALDTISIDAAPRLLPGDFGMGFLLANADDFSVDADSLDILDLFLPYLNDLGDGTDDFMGEPYLVDIARYDAAQVDGSGDDRDVSAYVLVTDEDAGDFVFVIAISGSGEFGQYEPTVFDVLETLETRELEPEPTATLEPTRTPEPTNTPDVAEPLDLVKTYTTADGLLTFNYPRGWEASEDPNQVVIASSSNLLGDQTSLSPGDWAALVFWFPADEVGLSGLSPTTVLEILLPVVAESAGMEFDDPYAITIGTLDGARADGNSLDGDAVIISVQVGDLVVVVAGITFSGEMEDFVPTLLAIIETIEDQGSI